MKEKKPMKNKTKLFLLQMFGYLALLIPILIPFIINRETYFTYKETLKVSSGCVICLIVAFCTIKGKTDFFKGIGGVGTVFLVSILLESIMSDIVLFSGMALIGTTIYQIFFKNPIAKYKRLKIVEENVEIESEITSKQTDKIVEAIKQIGGRV